MALDIPAVDHICNVVRREVENEYKAMSFVCVVYESGQIQQAIKAKAHEFHKHPCGVGLLDALEKTAEAHEGRSKFFALGSALTKQLWPPFKQQSLLAVLLVNAEDFQDPESVRRWCYVQVWHALRMREGLDAARSEEIILHTSQDPARIAYRNMLGDAFAAIIENLTGQDGHITAIARQRCRETLKKIPGHEAELFPFPITEDAAQIVYEDLLDSPLRETKPLTLAAEMATEIGHTFDDAAIQQWRDFANRAQEMAWMGYNKNKILSAAIFTSEDPYVRSMAYLVSEMLNMHPAPLGAMEGHNPFADQEVNERLHIKKAELQFKKIMQAKDRAEALMKKALEQNQALMEGHVTGWCAHALLDALMAYKDLHKTGDDLEEMATLRFQKALRETEWINLVKLSSIILHQRRAGQSVTPQSVQALCTENESMRTIAQALDNARPKAVKPETIETPEKETADEETPPAASKIQIDRSFR